MAKSLERVFDRMDDRDIFDGMIGILQDEQDFSLRIEKKSLTSISRGENNILYILILSCNLVEIS